MTTDGLPLGLSVDYDALALAGSARAVTCTVCDQVHEDCERRLSDGCRVLAVLCPDCRRRGRQRWCDAHAPAIPQAIARYR